MVNLKPAGFLGIKKLIFVLMKKNLILFIVIITSLSLLGIIVTQIVWVDRAIKLRTAQFNFFVKSGLSKIESQLYTYQEEQIINQQAIPDTSKISQHDTDWFMNGLCELVDTMVNNEFGCYIANNEFVYAVIDTNKKDLLCGNYSVDNVQRIYDSRHKISLSRMNNKNSLVLTVFFKNEKNIIQRNMFIWLLNLSGLFLMIVIICFLYIIFSLVKQKKISEMKNDFINNMTHELKTPISTISVASEMLMKPAVSENCEKTRKYANIIYDENLRLRNQVEQVLQISILDRNELKLNAVDLDVHRLIENSVDIFNMIVKEKGGFITTDLEATQFIIKADELHFINVLTNMLDNAIKYSREAPKISVTTVNKNQGIAIQIEDNGLGISSINQKYIFKKFYRVHTGDIHDVKGFGLGLYYVKSVMDAHNGTVNLIKSELHKGSVFELYFPFNFNKTNNDEHNSK